LNVVIEDARDRAGVSIAEPNDTSPDSMPDAPEKVGVSTEDASEKAESRLEPKVNSSFITL